MDFGAVFCAIVFFIMENHLSLAKNFSIPDTVVVKSMNSIRSIPVPTSHEPVLTWMEVRKGTFPETSQIEEEELVVGEPLTLYVYLKDNSTSYDLKVTDCWASNEADLSKASGKLHLSGGSGKRKYLSEWYKYNLGKGMEIRGFLYSIFKAFRFTESDQLYITCDIQLCFKKCKFGYKLANSIK